MPKDYILSLRMAHIKATSALKSFTGSHSAQLLIECTHVALIGSPLCQDENNHAGNSAVDSDLPSSATLTPHYLSVSASRW